MHALYLILHAHMQASYDVKLYSPSYQFNYSIYVSQSSYNGINSLREDSTPIDNRFTRKQDNYEDMTVEIVLASPSLQPNDEVGKASN